MSSSDNNPVTPGLMPSGPSPDVPPQATPESPESGPSPDMAPQSPASIHDQDDTIYTKFEPVFQYIVDDIIRLSQNSVIRYQDEVFELLDLITMSEKDIADITGRINGQDVKISKRDSRLLLHFVWWHQDLASQLLNTTLDNDIWLDYDRDDFTKFRREKVPTIAASGSSASRHISTTAVTGDVGAETVLQFQRSIKMEINQYPDFKGALEGWLPFKRKLKAITATHGIDRIITENPNPIIPEMQD